MRSGYNLWTLARRRTEHHEEVPLHPILAALGVAAAKADTISIVLDQTVLYGAPSSQVDFTGTITNLTSAPLYFNGSQVIFTVSTPDGYGIGPSYPFGSTAVLAPGASTVDTVLLNVDVPAHPDNSITFAGTLFGGPTTASNDDLGSFSVTLNSGGAPAPEIDPSLATSGLILVAGVIAILRERRVRHAAEPFL